MTDPEGRAETLILVDWFAFGFFGCLVFSLVLGWLVCLLKKTKGNRWIRKSGFSLFFLNMRVCEILGSCVFKGRSLLQAN